VVFELAKDPQSKAAAGFEAFRAALKAGMFDEAKGMLQEISAETDPDREGNRRLQYLLGLAQVRQGKDFDGDQTLRLLDKDPLYADRVALLRVLLDLRANRLDQARQGLAALAKVPGFAPGPELDRDLDLLNQVDEGPRRSVVLGTALSAVLPGSGQLYSGFLFDGLQSFLFCSLTGYAGYAGWSQELGPAGPKTRYILPSLATAAFLVFYGANLDNAADSARRYNQYHRAKRIGGVLDRLKLVIQDDATMLVVEQSLGR
jgi:hypothetical protein